MTLGNQSLVVKWAAARTEVDDAVMATVTTLYVSNLNYCVTQRMLQLYFSQWGEIKNCAIALKNNHSKGFGFVEYTVLLSLDTTYLLQHRPDCEMALKHANGDNFCGQPISVVLAKPPSKDKGSKKDDPYGFRQNGGGRGQQGRAPMPQNYGQPAYPYQYNNASYGNYDWNAYNQGYTSDQGLSFYISLTIKLLPTRIGLNIIKDTTMTTANNKLGPNSSNNKAVISILIITLLLSTSLCLSFKYE